MVQCLVWDEGNLDAAMDLVERLGYDDWHWLGLHALGSHRLVED